MGLCERMVRGNFDVSSYDHNITFGSTQAKQCHLKEWFNSV